MRCTIHPIDHSSANGVCASCLRERLFAVISAQAHADARAHKRHLRDSRRKSDANLPPQHFPRSVSPYISRRKSDTSPQNSMPDRKFFSTPEIGPAAAKKSKFSLLSKLFKFRSGKRITNSDPRISDCGISQSMFSDDGEDAEHYQFESNKYSPKTTATSGLGGGGGRINNFSWNVAGIGFCLSPLVRGEVVVSGEIRVQEKRRHSIGSPFCKNRSRKIVDFGRNERKH